jgi:hypothetical protein
VNTDAESSVGCYYHELWMGSVTSRTRVGYVKYDDVDSDWLLDLFTMETMTEGFSYSGTV